MTSTMTTTVTELVLCSGTSSDLAPFLGVFKREFRGEHTDSWKAKHLWGTYGRRLTAALTRVIGKDVILGPSPPPSCFGRSGTAEMIPGARFQGASQVTVWSVDVFFKSSFACCTFLPVLVASLSRLAALLEA